MSRETDVGGDGSGPRSNRCTPRPPYAATRQHLIGEQCGGLRHSPTTAARAEPAFLAAKGDEFFSVAVGATHAQEAVLEPAAFQVRLELVTGFAKEFLDRLGCPSYKGLSANCDTFSTWDDADDAESPVYSATVTSAAHARPEIVAGPDPSSGCVQPISSTALPPLAAAQPDQSGAI